ncbi:MAG: ROK family protein [Gemmatimonadota bacterium]|nr:ROK family protein [Gemmatimonadota bacterium]
MSAPTPTIPASPHVLVIDVGGTHVKALATGYTEHVKFDSGPDLTPTLMVDGVRKVVGDWNYDVVSIGFPAPVLHNKIMREPVNLAGGWMGFDFEQAFGKPVRIVNDALMQAIGSYTSGRMLFLGLGTGLGTAMVDEGYPIPLEIAHLHYKKHSYEEYLGIQGMKHSGHKKWQKHVHTISEELCSALICDYVVLGGGNAKLLKSLPPHGRLGDNANAFQGGFRMWAEKVDQAKKI